MEITVSAPNARSRNVAPTRNSGEEASAFRTVNGGTTDDADYSAALEVTIVV